MSMNHTHSGEDNLRILITGGAGYVGSHTCLELLRAGHSVKVIDNLDNGCEEALRRVESLTGEVIRFTKCDIRNAVALDHVFENFLPDAVIHFAGLKAVGESVHKPEIYYDVNVGGTAVLLGAMSRANCESIVFSSSATVYGLPEYLPYDEDHPTSPINPYGRTKLAAEGLLRDWASADSRRKAIALRYFNPVGADESGLIGEDPRGTPNNLMPYLTRVAVGKLPKLNVFGSDYDTKDGTGERDYVHVTDLALAHMYALHKIQKLASFEAINIGGGKSTSVNQLMREFEAASGVNIPVEYVDKRAGDLPAFWSDTKLAKIKLGWSASSSLKKICIDSWRWQSLNPEGYSND